MPYYLSIILILLALPIVFLIPFFVYLTISNRNLKKEEEEYQQCSYYDVTKKSFSVAKYCKGTNGEYETYRGLRHFENEGAKFLFNLYIPTSGGRTCEIDILMICSKGIFVIESKNYSGWIFGNEKQTYWYQTLKSYFSGRVSKFSFYNPVLQNNAHIKALKQIIGNYVPFFSIIAFSDACDLTNVHVSSPDICVVNSYFTTDAIRWIFNRNPGIILTQKDIGCLYDIFYPYTQVSDEIKMQHISNIKNFKNSDSSNNQKDYFDWW